ncbi:MAG: integrase [Methylobacterium mesophilicum]|nr:integrase [Methylobacterium mesophilicum]
MAARPRKTEYLLLRDGRYFARIVVPKALRPYLSGQTEMRQPLGPDRREAKRLLATAVAAFQHKIGEAERRMEAATGNPVIRPRFPMTAEQMARRIYDDALASDQAWRHSEFSKQWTQQQIDWDEARRFRDGYSGALTDDELEELVGLAVEGFRKRGNHDATFGSDEWRRTAQAICYARAEAFVRQDERNEGNFAGTPALPLIDVSESEEEEDKQKPVSLYGLLDRYLKERETDGKPSKARRRWTSVFESLKKAIGHDDATRLTKANIQDWLDEQAKTLAPKTISDTYLASVRAVLNWAHDNDHIPENPVSRIKRRKVKKIRTREKGYTLEEAVAVLKAARAYKPSVDEHYGRERELPQMTAAKRWGPFLAAFSGARIVEICQLRKEDVRKEGDINYLRITPEAGSTKSAGFRDVPVHAQLIQLGFLKFVETAPEGPLFFPADARSPLAAARTVSGRISQWLQKAGLVPEGLKPNHAWRHRFKTVGLEIGLNERTIDAIQDHAPRTAGETYGDVTLLAKDRVISALPSYDLA